MVMVFCCDSGFYRFTVACCVSSKIDWASGGGLYLVHLAFASSPWLTLQAFGLCLVHWLAPRALGLRFELLACASFIGLRLVQLAYASSS